jgi:hypothetical protein
MEKTTQVDKRNISVDREQFTNVIRRLVSTPPLPKAVLSKKIARTAQAKKPQATAQKSEQ